MGQPNLKDKDEATAAYDNGYYEDKLEEGLQFQDYITDVLYNEGMVVVTYVSRERSKGGENKLGIEIKRDGRFRETGNLYIEVAEKSHPRNDNYWPSGICREDNSWLYAIGDEKTIWIFSKNILRLLWASKRFKHAEIVTSKGFLLPLLEAGKYASKVIEVEKL
ncbi:MAG: hypothetical protein ACYTBZ_31225 [Planctomycetota bacterium]